MTVAGKSLNLRQLGVVLGIVASFLGGNIAPPVLPSSPPQLAQAQAVPAPDLDEIKVRLTALESKIPVQFDAIISRLERIERKLDQDQK